MNATNSKGFGHNVHEDLMMLDENLYPLHTPQKRILKKGSSIHGHKIAAKKSNSFNIQD
jgi:hypothetical protein